MSIIATGLLLASATLGGVRYEAEPQTSETSQVAEATETTEKAFDFGEWLKETFTPEVIASIVSCVTAVAALLKLVAVLKDLSRSKKTSLDELTAKVIKALEESNIKQARSLIEPLEGDVGQLKEVLDIFAKILALSQDGSAESKVAILELIQKIGNVDSGKLAEEAKKAVISQAEESQRKIEKAKETLDEVIGDYDGTSV